MHKKSERCLRSIQEANIQTGQFGISVYRLVEHFLTRCLVMTTPPSSGSFWWSVFGLVTTRIYSQVKIDYSSQWEKTLEGSRDT